MTTTSATSGNSLSSLLSSLTGSSGSSGSSSGSGSSSTGTAGGTISSAGIGSGLNVNAIVSALVQARQSAPQAQIDGRKAQTNNLLTGLASLNSALGSLQSALSQLSSVNTFGTFAATLSNSAVGTTSTLSSAQPGSYSVAVSQLATVQSCSSGALATGAAVGAGTLSVTVGARSMNLTVSATDTLATIATAINSASSNPGVTATVINGANGQQLMLSSNKTGVANGFSISAGSGSSSGLSALASQLSSAGANEAHDAQLTINGIQVSSASNTVSGALDGVTLNLAATGTTQLQVTRDNSAAITAVQGFVTAYNNYEGTVASLSSYDKTSGSAGVLLGDTTLTSVKRQISMVLSGTVKGNSVGSLAALGIVRDKNGQLVPDNAKLSSALNANPNAVKDLFNGSAGYGTRLNAVINSFAGPGTVIPTRIASLNNTLTQLGKQQTDLTNRMAVYQKQLQTQYTQLDTLMSSLNNTSSYLSTALQQLTGSGSSKN
jgi:flagellar hook-associated protein 2